MSHRRPPRPGSHLVTPLLAGAIVFGILGTFSLGFSLGATVPLALAAQDEPGS